MNSTAESSPISGRSRGDHVLVIGGGVIGAMCAWYLQESGKRVTIVDRAEFGSGCSHGNCGYVCPSHILPLAQPGVVRNTLKGMLRRSPALRVGPRVSTALLRWLYRFAQKCNRTDMLAAACGRHALLQSSMALYKSLINEQEINCEWQSRGLLFVYDTAEQFENYRVTHNLIRDHFGVEAKAYDGDALLAKEPALRSGLGGAWHYEGDCHIRPDLLLSALRQRLEARGVKIVENQSFVEFIQDAGTASSAKIGNQIIEADQFVVATGALTPMLNKQLGCRIPIQPGKGYSLTYSSTARMPRIPMIFETSHIAVTPMQSRYRIGSMMEFSGYDASIKPARVAHLKTVAYDYLPNFDGEPIEQPWFGWRPMTWDGKPFIDRSPTLKNVWIAAGHSMLGLSMAPATGRLVTELICGEKPHIDVSHFSLARP